MTEPSKSVSFGELWNSFWYTPVTGQRIGLMRVAIGLAALVYFAMWTIDLERFLAPNGLLPPDVVNEALSADPLYYPSRFSLLDYMPNRSALWGFHIASIVAAALCMFGIASRFMTILTLVAVLSYVNRAPLLMTPQEPLLCWSLLYLCLTPCGRCCSLDGNWSKVELCSAPNVANNVALRLMQIHLSLHYFFVATTQLSDRNWWTGSAVWVLMAQSRTRGLDLTAIRESTFLLNALTHLLVILAFALALAPWNRGFRSIANWLVIPYAILVSAITGLWLYSLILVGLQVIFLREDTIAKYLTFRPQNGRNA
jgi:hypothetical protein